MKLKINREIALTHILTRKKQTIIAALGVTIGIAFFIFSNSMMGGFTKYSRTEMFKLIAHISIYKEDEISKPLFKTKNGEMVLIRNPKIINQSKKILDPYNLLETVKKKSYVTNTVGRVNVDLFYNNGKSQLKGIGNAFTKLSDADQMLNIKSTMLIGDLESIDGDINVIIIGKGVAEKMNVGIDDYLTLSSSLGTSKVMRIVGVFSVGNKATDQSKCYMNMKAAQQLMKEGQNYITEILVNIKDPNQSLVYAKELQKYTNYKVEDWQTSNSDTLAGDKVRDTMGIAVPVAILLVAAFGIYNILNMTISQKLHDIAILKATGFSGKDIVNIFVSEAFIMGVIGSMLGVGLGAFLVSILKRIYMGGPVGYFPIYYEPSTFIMGVVFGMLVTLGAGYFPARRAAKIDPVAIFRGL